MASIRFVIAVLIASLLFPSHSWSEDNRRRVVAWKFVPMNYSFDENAEEMRKNDMRAAIEMGLDGFALEAYTYGHALELISNFSKAADSIGAQNFKFFLVLDLGAEKFTAENILELIINNYNNPHYLKYNNRPVLSTYGGQQRDIDDRWWNEKVIKPLKIAGHPITFIPYIDRDSPNTIPPTYENWVKLIQKHPSVDGLLLFSPPKGVPFYQADPNGGHQKWSGLETEENEAKALHDNQKYFIAPYQPYYWLTCKGERPYYEYQGGRGMENFWKSAIYKQRPEMITLITWDDYSESTYVQPTRIPLTKYPKIETFPHLGYYELLKYYISWYKTDMVPIITKDAFFYFYRTHRNEAVASDDSSACPLGRVPEEQKWGLMSDVIYITTALTEPAELVVKTGSKTTKTYMPAGIHTTDIPFESGSQLFELDRDNKILAKISGRNIDEHPKVYNFNLYSGYVVVNGKNSEVWEPSDSWKSGFVSDWFITP
ncbi:MAG: endo-1,3-alpha-glucanase family glycosylhydrolase [Desulfocapsaceae bacterium]|nr:endo-1,3-alpha-glucanase family glycosylhydrolase [Desulfocapsaceae bacterium]